MRILLAHNSTYYPAHGGGDRSNRLLIEALAAYGHTCRVVARTGGSGPAEQEKLRTGLAQRGLPFTVVSLRVVQFTLASVEVHTVTDSRGLRPYFAAQLSEFQPDIVICSTDDPAQLLLEAALQHEAAHVVFLTRATLALPFGPDCAFPSRSKTAVLAQADRIVGVSEYVARYIRQWGPLPATHVPISLMEPGPWIPLGRFDNPYVTITNPCAVKGIDLFLQMADALPSLRFAAVPTWGTNSTDLAKLRTRCNVEILPAVDNIDDLLLDTRVLLVPSLWAEARSRIVVEAMLRGVPVLASDVGGIPEAKLGVDYLLPVQAIERYESRVDENMVPVADVPPQDAGPWIAALERVTTDRAHYEALSQESRSAAAAYAESLSVQPFEDLLLQAMASTRQTRTKAVEPAELSPERRRLLALKLRQKAVPERPLAAAWFRPGPQDAQATHRLFCFPYAGGGAAAFRGWEQGLPAGWSLWPVVPPGRETRLAEPPFSTMEALVEAVLAVLPAHLDRPFAFFGHSMGAIVAFEVARRLREIGQPLPALLIASAARAPQFRLGHVPGPEPSEEELQGQLRRLAGTPESAFVSPEFHRLVLPPLCADTALYRHYLYTPAPPLALPIRAYGGDADENIQPFHVEAWREQTTGSFRARFFPGGHFYWQRDAGRFWHELAADLHTAQTSGDAAPLPWNT